MSTTAPPNPAVPSGTAPAPAVAPFDAGEANGYQAAWAKYLGTNIETTNSVGMKMILIPPGEFLMGSTDEQVRTAESIANATGGSHLMGRVRSAERPLHRVVITKPFWMGATEVTIGQFKLFAEATGYKTSAEAKPGANYLQPGYAVTDASPAAVITSDDTIAFCNWLSQKESREEQSGKYALPTEAQWEYACRAGTATQYYFGDDYAELGRNAWYLRNSDGRTHSVGSLAPNAFGLFDMHGSLQELCADYFSSTWYSQSGVDDPTGPEGGTGRVFRGASWVHHPIECRAAFRVVAPGNALHNAHGFRVVLPMASLQPLSQSRPLPVVAASGASTRTPTARMPTARPTDTPPSTAQPSSASPKKGSASDYVAAEGLPKPHAHFLFNGSGGDEVSDESRTTLKNVEFRDGALFVNGRSRSDGSGLSSTARLVTRPVSSKTFTLAMRIRAEDFDPAHAVLVGAPDWQPPFKLGTADNGILSMNFGQARSRTFEGAELRPDEWTVVAYGVDLNVGRCTVFLNGKKVGDWDIAKRNATEVAGDDEPRTTWTFSNVFGNTSFHGLVDEFILYDRLLTSDEFAKIPLRADLTSPMVSRHPPEVLRDFAAEARTRVAGRPTGPARMVSRFLFNGNTSDELNPTNTSNQYMRGAKFEQDALHLDSKSGYGTLRAKPVGSRAFTVALRFKASDFSNSHAQLLTSNIGGGFSMYRNSDTGNLTVSLDNLAFFREVDGAHLEPARWTTLVCGIDMDLGKCVVRFNGRPAGSFDFPATLETSQLGWCTFSTYGHRGRFQGLIDELLLYDRLLTEEEFDQVPLDSGP
jgi:formylglycine-generating enzyme required for sulfatase activity